MNPLTRPLSDVIGIVKKLQDLEQQRLALIAKCHLLSHQALETESKAKTKAPAAAPAPAAVPAAASRAADPAGPAMDSTAPTLTPGAVDGDSAMAAAAVSGPLL